MIIFDSFTSPRCLSRLDPRVRLLATLLFSVVICLCERPLVLVSGLACSLLFLCISGVPMARGGRRILSLNGIMLLLLVTMPLFMPGTPLLRLGGLVWTQEGVFHALQVAARANATMIMLTALLGTVEPAHLGFALHGIGVSGTFTQLLVFMVRYIEVIHHEYHHLRDAMVLRAFRPRFNGHTLRTFGYMVGQLLVRSVQRSERILDAMKCRGFRGRFHLLAPCRIGVADIAFSVAALVGITALIVMEWT